MKIKPRFGDLISLKKGRLLDLLSLSHDCQVIKVVDWSVALSKYCLTQYVLAVTLTSLMGILQIGAFCR